MTLTELAVDRFEAWTAFKEYRGALKQRASAEDRALANAYRELSKRRRVIDLIGSMRTAGVDQWHRPKLAIVRADSETVGCSIDRDGGGYFAIPGMDRANRAAATITRLPAGTFPVISADEWPKLRTWFRARTPLIPPRFRPAHDLSNYFLLWEAEWLDVPKDPILLRHLGKNFYAVLAQWDLTPVEQAVLRTRPR